MNVNRLTIVSHTAVGQSNPSFSIGSFSRKIGGWLNRLLGCWHLDMSYPISIQGQTYRTCVDCGAQRQFNLGNWQMQGDFYYRRPTTSHLRALTGLVPRQSIARTQRAA